jgi:hypothetical protein
VPSVHDGGVPIDPPINVCSPEELIEAIAEQDKLALNEGKSWYRSFAMAS